MRLTVPEPASSVIPTLTALEVQAPLDLVLVACLRFKRIQADPLCLPEILISEYVLSWPACTDKPTGPELNSGLPGAWQPDKPCTLQLCRHYAKLNMLDGTKQSSDACRTVSVSRTDSDCEENKYLFYCLYLCRIYSFLVWLPSRINCKM